MEGLKRVGILLLEALADAFEFVGLEAVNWVTKLIDPPKVEKKLGQQTTMRDFQRVAEKAWDKLGGAFGDLLEAGGGLVAYLFGGTFRGRNIPYEESLFGKMFAQTEEASSEPGLFEGIANNIFSGLSNIFGLEKIGAIFSLQGTGIGEKFEMGLLLMEAKMYRSLANLVNNMATWGKATVTRMEKDGVEGLDALNLPYQLAKGLASLGDFKDPHSASGALKKMADEADAAAANMRAGMEMLDQRIREEILDFESKTKSLGFSDEADAIKSLRDQFGEYLTIDENDTSRIIEINSKNIKEIISALEKSNYDYNPNVSGESQSFDMTSITISKQAAEEISKANDSAIQTINESFGESLVDVGSSVSSDLTDGLQMGLESSIDDLSQSGADMASAIEDGIRDQSQTQSPSMVFYNVGVDMADGLLAGFFGDESLIPGSSVTGFISQFNSRMVEVDQMIQDSYRNISEAAVVAISTKLGRVGEVLSGDKPLQVVVDNQKLEIKVQLHVNMDSRDVASGIASAAGGSYFTVNENRNKSARNFRALEID